MFPRAHKILLVIICNGWFEKDIIQTGVSDYIDYRQDALSKDYSNLLPTSLKVLANSKLPSPKQKETLGEFTKRAKPRSIVNSIVNPQANPRSMVNPPEQISKNSVQAKPSPKANPRFMVNPSEQISKNSLPAKPSPKANPRFMVNPSEQISKSSLPANPSSKANPRFMVNPSEQTSGNSIQANPSPKHFSKGNHQKILNVNNEMFCLIIFIRDLRFI